MTYRFSLFALLMLATALLSFGQTDPTPASVRHQAYETRLSRSGNSLAANVPMTNIGPAIMSGRVVDLDVNEDAPQHYYVAFASGGLWVTHN